MMLDTEYLKCGKYPGAAVVAAGWSDFRNVMKLSKLWNAESTSLKGALQVCKLLISIYWRKPTTESWNQSHEGQKNPSQKNSLTKFTKCHPCKMHQIAIFGGNSDKRYAPNSTDFIWIFSARGRSFRSLSLSSQKKTWSMLPFPPCKIFFFSLVCEERSKRVLCELFL